MTQLGHPSETSSTEGLLQVKTKHIPSLSVPTGGPNERMKTCTEDCTGLKIFLEFNFLLDPDAPSAATGAVHRRPKSGGTGESHTN
jgi:hypothetical protein